MTGYLAFSLWGGWHDVVAAFSAIGLQGTLLALGMSLLNYGLRFVRWQLYLARLGHRLHWRPSLRIYLSGFALTTTPGKAGEAFRGVLLSKRGVPFSISFAAFISERMSDLVAVILLTLLGMAEFPEARSAVLLGTAGILTVLFLISSETALNKLLAWSNKSRRKLVTIASHIIHALHGARRCQRADLLFISTIISVIAWGAEAVAFYWVLDWLGADISVSFAIFVYALSMLVGALSFLPGGLGSAEAVMISLLVLKGMSTPDAIAATVFIRLATLWFAVLIGLVALIKSRHGESLGNRTT
ncbi:lysylphosphatidylglycerol synthase transmembrane domain-containing protein [Marinobacter alkaliphilus]|uniref:Lysylphosphatidylglycerol synthase transmembrane domain-containing protein n=2 Tax=Marinobacter alkaliphilus TaxID=254719 RepID=A0ABZ3E828_9GAMM